MMQVALNDEAQLNQKPLLMQRHANQHFNRSKYDNFLRADPNLQRWYNNLKRGSEYMADIYFRRLCALCVKLRTTPDDFQKLSQKSIEEIAQDYANKLEETVRSDGKHYAPQYIESKHEPSRYSRWNENGIHQE